MENILQKHIGKLITLGAALVVLFTVLVMNRPVDASAPSGLGATVATTTLGYTVQVSQTVLFATSTCAARVVTTRAQPIMLTFSDVQGKVPTAVSGHLQLASTTVTYDSGQYGCGTFRVISATPSTDTISVSESR